MKTLFCFFVAGFYLSQCLERESCEEDYNDYSEVRCLTDRPGHALFTCKPLIDITGRQNDSGKYVWAENGHRTLCSKPLDGCRCYDHNYATWWDQDCECYNPTRAPEFPHAGAISWNGFQKKYDAWEDDSEKETLMKGVVCKFENGTYLRKERREIGGMVKNTFELIIPDRDVKTYTKYSGTDKTRLCRKEIVDNEESLSNIWNQRYRFPITSEVNVKPNLRVQTWKVNSDGEDYNERYTWIVNYDIKKKIATPVSYRFYFYDEIEGNRNDIQLKYSFKEDHQDCHNIKPDYYCDDI